MPHVIVVGAGIAGLSAAISLRRAGHVIHVYERSSMANEVGAAINVPPNATRFLTAWGLDPKRWRFVKSRLVTYNNPFSMQTTAVLSTDTTATSIGGAELYYTHRVDLHDALKWMATSSDGPGAPVTIHLNSDVVNYDPSEPSITLSGGEKVTGDAVIAADGVHSLASELVTGQQTQAAPPRHANCCFRFLIPAATLEDDPDTRFWNEDCDGWARLFPHNETNRSGDAKRGSNTVHNFVGIFHDENLELGNREDWQAGVDVSEVLEKFSDFSPQLLKVIRKATHVKRWPLLYRHPTSTWKRGRMVLAGDAAHPMLPHQGQGGAQGMEDGLALGILLHGADTPEVIESRLRMYVDIRRNRASAIQILSNVGQDQSQLVRKELMQYMADDEIPNSPGDNFRYNFGYDIVRTCVGEMRKLDVSFQLAPGFFEGKLMGVPEE